MSKQYMIIVNRDISQLQYEVQRMVNVGFVPVGGVAIDEKAEVGTYGTIKMFIQAVYLDTMKQ